jgi:uracil-DNA glycosylase
LTAAPRATRSLPWPKRQMHNHTLPAAWTQCAVDEAQLTAVLNALPADHLPPREQIFAALELCEPSRVSVVILGQDPYPTPGHAHGLAFSVTPQTRPLPRSLSNIFKELNEDTGITASCGDLRPWAKQGVLLLNSVLTVSPQTANGHKNIGWQVITTAFLRLLDDRPRALILWGKQAQQTAACLQHPDHLRIETPHPSPLSAHRGFFGTRPFSRVNEWLKAKGHAEIDWNTG